MTHRSKTLTRRGFLAAGGSLALCGAAAGFAGGGHGAMRPPVPKPSAGTAAGKSRVVLVKTADRKAGVRKSLEILGLNPGKGKSVLVKPNFNTSDPTPGSTHNDTLHELLAAVKDMGPKSLAVGDRSGPEPTEEVLAKLGIHELAAGFDAEVINLDELGEDGYVRFDPPGSHWKDGFLVARPVVEAECVISTCCLKTHQFGGVFTMALKNSVGVVPRKGHGYMRELHGSPDMRKMIAEINWAYTPALVVLDGIDVFVDGGPMKGELRTANVFLAGTDRVAVDAVGLAVLKHLGSNKAVMETPIFAQEQIARAAELGLGAGSAEAIEIVTADNESAEYAGRIEEILNA